MNKFRVELKITNEFDNTSVFSQEQDIETIDGVYGGHIPYILETVSNALVAMTYNKEDIEEYLKVEY